VVVHKVTLEQFTKELGKLPGDMEKAIVRGLRSAAQRGVSEVVQAINTSKPHAAVDTGQLARSVEATDVLKGGRILVDAPHAAVIETGARPFWPPLQPLKDWAQRKFGVDEEEAAEIARAVQMKIAMFGIEPRHYFRTAMARVRKIVPIEVESELGKI